ncbi:hypothetical protein A9Q78_07855 [Methylophaga sp. 41_12_T18]|nr:hypothetical protein A9Q78_07855 [Methylophaga sp. 41_12_T18]
MRNKTFASLAVASALGLLTPFASHAFGLGKMDLQSALNEPFKAEIAVTTLRAGEADSLQVKLASNKEFDKAGLERTHILSQLQFDVVQVNGVTRITVQSDQAVKEPLLDFLIIATTGQGRLIREYTVLLDPPKNVRFKAPAKTVVAKKTAIDVKPVAKTTSYQYDEAEVFSATQYGPTDKTDTLWNIAIKTRPEKSLSVNQMMMALLKQNPTAFHRNNINGLKAGHTLDIPSLDTINSLNKAQATAGVSEQNDLWKNRNKVQQPVSQPAADLNVTTEEQVSTTTEQVVADITDADAIINDDNARLKLLVPSDETSLNDENHSLQGDSDISKLSEQLTFAQETIEAQAQENIDFKERMMAMEEQLETLRRIIALKDPDLARLQHLLHQEQQGDASVAENAEAIIDEALALIQQSDDVASAAIASESLDTELEESIAADDLPVNSDSETVVTEQAVIDSSLTEDTPSIEAEQSVISDVMDNIDISMMVEDEQINGIVNQIKAYVTQNKMTALLGSLLILLLIWLVIRHRNRPAVSWDEAVEKIESDDDVATQPAVSVLNNDAEDDSDLVSAKQPEKTVADFINQADMFVGYADYVQAKTALEQAALLEPNNRSVVLKTLFVLYKQQQVAEYIALVEQSSIDSASSEWDEVAEWGHELAPEHDLFITLQDSQLEDTLESTDIASEEPITGAEGLTQQAELETAEEPDHLEFNLDDFKTDNDVSEPVVEPTRDDDLMAFDTNFDLDSSDKLDNDVSKDFDAPLTLDIGAPSMDEATEPGFEQATNDLSVEFDVPAEQSLDISAVETELSIDEPLEDESLAMISDSDLEQAAQELGEQSLDFIPEVEIESTDENSDIEFDLGDFDEIDEAETKLDLASAYIDMGDPEGAKSILDEVLNEGSDEQKGRAQSLLNDLS